LKVDRENKAPSLYKKLQRLGKRNLGYLRSVKHSLQGQVSKAKASANCNYFKDAQKSFE
jgi:hypothetical protein